jgi:hypothetical protein
LFHPIAHTAESGEKLQSEAYRQICIVIYKDRLPEQAFCDLLEQFATAVVPGYHHRLPLFFIVVGEPYGNFKKLRVTPLELARNRDAGWI